MHNLQLPIFHCSFLGEDGHTLITEPMLTSGILPEFYIRSSSTDPVIVPDVLQAHNCDNVTLSEIYSLHLESVGQLCTSLHLSVTRVLNLDQSIVSALDHSAIRL